MFNQVFRSWVKEFLPAAIFGLSFAFIATMLVTFRATKLPALMFCVFPASAAFCMGIIFWVSYDAIMAKRVSEDIVGNLQSATWAYAQHLDDMDRKELLKRAKALRPATIPIGIIKIIAGLAVQDRRRSIEFFRRDPATLRDATAAQLRMHEYPIIVTIYREK